MRPSRQAVAGELGTVLRVFPSTTPATAAGSAEREVLEQELDIERLRSALGRFGQRIGYRLLAPDAESPSPEIERLRRTGDDEKLGARIERHDCRSDRAAAS